MTTRCGSWIAVLAVSAAASPCLGGVSSRPATRPASAVEGLRARAADLEREEIGHLRALIRLASVADDTPALRTAYRGLVRLGAATADDRLALAALSIAGGHLDEATAVLTDLRSRSPSDIRVVCLMAAAAERAGRLAERDALLQAADDLLPADKGAHLKAGDFLAGRDLVAFASRQWRRVLAIRPQEPDMADVEAHLRLAGLARRREAYADAVAHYREARRLAESDDVALPETSVEWLTVELASALRDAGQIDEARTHLALVEGFYARRLERDPTDTEAMNALGWFYAGLGEHLDKGIALLEKALVLEPDRPAYLDTLAELHFRKGDAKRALDLIDRAIAAGPDNPAYYRRQREKFSRAVTKDPTP